MSMIRTVAVLGLGLLLAAEARAQAIPGDPGSNGTLDWAVMAGGPGADYVYDVIVLADGGIVVTGEYWDEITFGASTFDAEGVDELNEECDMFVAKYSAQGVFVWANHAGGKYSDRGLRIRDVSGNIEVTGTGFADIKFSDTVTLEAEEEYYFVATYNGATGAFISANLPATGQDDTPLMQPSVDLGFPNWFLELSDGSSVRTGKVWLKEKVGGTTVTSEGGEDALIVRQNASGNVLWAKHGGGLGKDWGTAVAARPSGVGGVVMVGNFEADAVFGKGENEEVTLAVSSSDAESEIFIAKYRVEMEITQILESEASRDGYIVESAAVPGEGGTAFSNASDPNALRLGDDSAQLQYVVIVSFDTSGIPDAATISSAKLKMVRSTQTGDDPFVSLAPLTVDVKRGAFNGNTALEIVDFQAPADAVAAATMSNPPSNGSTSSGGLNVAGRDAINKTGVTQIRVRFTFDDDGDSNVDGMSFFSGENATAANRPKLQITYY